MDWFWRSLYEAAAMYWEVFWALVLGFAASACLQVFVTKEQMSRTLGTPGLKQMAIATALGAASSSCSYAAAATAKTAFKKGAALAPTLAFMFASTNLVFELGIVLWLMMGWRFVLAEFVGAFVLIAFMWAILALTLPKNLEQQAREQTEAGDSHDHMHHSRVAQESRFVQIAHAFAMDWSMLWREMLVGFLVAGFLSVLVPTDWWRAAFLAGGSAGSVKLLENAVVGPLIAVASFVCSIGNIPLASILWSGGISFGGVISFIYADLIVAPLIVIYAKYYGWRTAIYITTVMFVSMVLAGIVVDLLFSALHLVPSGARLPNVFAASRIAWNYTTWLDIAALAVAAVLAAAHFRSRPQVMDLHDDHSAINPPENNS